MMRLQSGHKRAALRAIGPGVLLAMSIGLSGCAFFEGLEPGENVADKYGEYAGFCGFLQDCGGNGNSNRGGGQTATGSSSSSGGSSSGTGGGESAARAGMQ